MKKQRIGRGLILLLLVSTCIFAFNPPKTPDAPIPVKTHLIKTEDMQQGGYYYFWDHGSASVAQYDRTENGNIYTNYSITPLQLLFSTNRVFTEYEAGAIQPASALEIAHLQLCILSGHYVP